MFGQPEARLTFAQASSDTAGLRVLDVRKADIASRLRVKKVDTSNAAGMSDRPTTVWCQDSFKMLKHTPIDRSHT